MTIQIDSFRMDTPPESDTGHALPKAHDRDSLSVNGR